MQLPEHLHPWIAVAVTVAVFVALQVRRGVPTDLLFVGGLVLLTITGVLQPRQALAGFANPAIFTVAGLLVISAGLRTSGVLDWIGHKLLGTANTARSALLRLTPVLVAASAFLLNTALVAMMMPVVVDWCRRRQVSPSKLLIPLSYLTILGGVCTLIGTSTTLVANGILREQHAQRLEVVERLTAERDAAARADGAVPTTTKTGEPSAAGKSETAARNGATESPANFGNPETDIPAAIQLALAQPLHGQQLNDQQLNGQQLNGQQLNDQQPRRATNGEELERATRFADGVRPMALFELGKVGLPCAVVGTAFLILVGVRFLPKRTDIVEQLGEQRREYLLEMLVQPECPLIGSNVERAGLRQLPGLFLIEIDRAGEVLTPVTPHDVIHAHDRLVFTGIVNTIVDLEKIPGLVPAADRTYEFQPDERQKRHLTEVVLSRSSPLIGRTVREGNFRQLYNAAVVAVHRNGVRVTNKIGNIRLEPGDTLLLQTRDDFVSTHRNSRDFYLVSAVQGDSPRRHDKMLLASCLTGLLILWLVISSVIDRDWGGWSSPAVAALAIAVAMVLTRCVRVSEARQAIDLPTLVTIAAALGLGMALTQSGAARNIATTLVDQVGERPLLLLLVIYVMGQVFTETITNNAVAAMLIPIAIEVAWEGGFAPRPFIMAITLSASLSFVTPIGYQTNLMVMGPGGYRPLDYLRCGLPLAIVLTAMAVWLIPIAWPL